MTRQYASEVPFIAEDERPLRKFRDVMIGGLFRAVEGVRHELLLEPPQPGAHDRLVHHPEYPPELPQRAPHRQAAFAGNARPTVVAEVQDGHGWCSKGRRELRRDPCKINKKTYEIEKGGGAVS